MARDIYVKPEIGLEGLLDEYRGVRRAPTSLEAALGAAQAIPMGLAAGRRAQEDRALKLRQMQEEFLTAEAKRDEMAAHAGYLRRMPAERESPPPKAPQGFRWTAGGKLEPIPGGPAEQKVEAVEEKKRRNAEYIVNKSNNISNAITNAIKNIGWATTGYGGRFASAVGLPKRETLQGYLDTIKSNLGFDELNKMRQSSPTGGALGNVSDRELSLLTATVASLNPAQGEKTLLRNLGMIKDYIKVWDEESRRELQKGPKPSVAMVAPPRVTPPVPLTPAEKARLAELRFKKRRK